MSANNHRFYVDLTQYHYSILIKLIDAQYEKGLAHKVVKGFFRDQIVQPVLEEINKKYGDDYSQIEKPLDLVIREALSNHLTLDNSKAIGGSLKAATV